MKFNQAYTYLIQQLPPSLVEEAWRRLTTRKRNPFTLLEACGIDPAIEDFLQHEIIVYNRKKERQRRMPPCLPLNILCSLFPPKRRTTSVDFPVLVRPEIISVKGHWGVLFNELIFPD
ncbi:18866_t:CDS:2 [Entrophospora sp. SA101]|nr:9133_t:CDS:2 [Entrophospora sp. SA101]CAJ0839266.1 1535_t:CDS:2 [Entrophospora sp. SA101]CAJ0868193.1 18779_t:CDS:2 [Entrophospora sp. SA101]CAJ0902106.1 3235_t:CDS:2 [Entrophospora sp. SA101]CAJ0925660.1 18866_t:CDS:2 [Entrophospora sp. SA101]